MNRAETKNYSEQTEYIWENEGKYTLEMTKIKLKFVRIY